jgi:hypothetical protein
VEGFLTQVALVFAMFLVLAASVEVVVEVLREPLRWLGVPVRSQVGVEEAIALAAAVGGASLEARAHALLAVARGLGEKASAALIAGREVATLTGSEAALIDLASELAAYLDAYDRRKVWVLRTLAGVIGCVLVWSADFRILSVTGLESTWIDVLVGGLAAAAGSSYWHDKLDRVRTLKDAVTTLKSPLPPPAPTS